MPDPELAPTLPVDQQSWWKAKLALFVALIFGLLVTALILSALLGNLDNTGSSSTSTSATPTPASSSASLVPVSAPTDISVYFSKHPDSDNNMLAVFPLTRTVHDSSLATTAFNYLLNGPTIDETAEGYFSSWQLSGVSNCDGNNFFMFFANDGTMTITLCRDFASAGIGQDVRAQAEADKTLKQFSDITKVVYLNKEGNCLFDESGQNQCFK